MDNPRPEKVAVVDEVRKRLSDSDAVLLTEYRGINVGASVTLSGSGRLVALDWKRPGLALAF